ncbi:MULTISPECIES: hypothetical protein [Butyrivibrio]|uniref:Uncharacterized protein n=1 Tax=Butyrivibrio fibrisolvens TaxID=831 RepID=A0A317G5G2_BUTFI|nr:MULTISPECIES: hypothetical protein [Butyrivibrio]MCR5770193.1 hypothetical protein [Butyrivibrio sp.]PWT28476.1 hypothetical protein CPT75_15845 [Butyrivibrio fibrisolvens]
MKKVQAACICQTLHFCQREEMSKEENEKLAIQELESYKASLEKNNTEYRILEEKKQDDGTIIIKIIKQYSNSPIGEYLQN